jgi:hypothetical protein
LWDGSHYGYRAFTMFGRKVVKKQVCAAITASSNLEC